MNRLFFKTNIFGQIPRANAIKLRNFSVNEDTLKKTENETIKIQDFTKVDIRVAKIVSCDSVPGADKLLKLTLDVGSGVLKTVFSGIKQHYSPEKLIGKQTLWLANLQPRTFKFGTSEGMILAASDAEGKEVFLSSVDSGAKEGMRVM